MLTVEDVLAALGIPLAGGLDRDWCEAVTAAAAEYVDRLPHVTPGAWDSPTRIGATMLAVRLYHSRSAPLGAAGADIAGGLVRATTDPEVGRLLRLGRYQTPRAG